MNFSKKNYEHLKSTKNRLCIFTSIILVAVLLISCSKEDDFNPNASDLNITIDENPTNGTVLGTIATNLTGTLVYTITSQSITNALTINSSTGQVTVNDATMFDYETNTFIDASVSVTNSENTAAAMISVNLNNVDDIASFLSTSKQAYTNATNGDWILITESEYNNLAASINNVSKVATTDEEYETPIYSSAASLFTFSNNNGSNIAAQSYLFAFKYKANANDVTGVKVKQTDTNIDEGYTDVGNDFPTHNQGDNYFVLKGSNAMTANEGYVAITASYISFKNDSAKNMRYASGNVSTLNTSYSGYFYYQGLSTTQKQWD